MQFANQQTFDLTALVQAREGIVAPHKRFLLPGTRICRFADTEGQARRGAWWFEFDRLAEIRDWAATNRLAVPHAARALGAVTNGYDGMRVMVCALVTAPLLAYRGKGRTPFILKQGRIGELLEQVSMKAPVSLKADAQVEQLYVPGLKDAAIREASVRWLSAEHFEPRGTTLADRIDSLPQARQEAFAH